MSDQNSSVRTTTKFWKVAYSNAWATADVQRLRELAGQGISPGQVAKLLRRSESAVRNKAGLHGISFQRKMQFDSPNSGNQGLPALAEVHDHEP